MSKKLIVFCIGSMALIIFGIVMTVIGIVKISVLHIERDVHSKYVELERNVIVYLPPGYELEPHKRYPVLYMLDGERYFKENKEESKFDWSMKKTLDKLIKGGSIEKVIVVGIHSTANRKTEYAPSQLSEHKEGGDVTRFSRFVIEELKPFIDRKYRTRTDVESTGIAGADLGGLASLYIGLEHVDVFSKVGALQPSVDWISYGFSEVSNENIDRYKSLRIWLDDEKIEQQAELQTFFDNHGIPFVMSEIENEENSEIALDQRLGKMLLSLYGN